MTRTAQAAMAAIGASDARTNDGANAGSRQNGPGEALPSKGYNLLLRSAAFIVLTTLSAALLALPYMATARSAPEDQTGYSARLQEAFRTVDETPANDKLRATLLAAAAKSDRLSAAQDCDGQTWPWIHPRCLRAAEHAGATQPARTVTVEYHLGASTSALVRLPVQQLASQP
jgi:hypothetical protein